MRKTYCSPHTVSYWWHLRDSTKYYSHLMMIIAPRLQDVNTVIGELIGDYKIPLWASGNPLIFEKYFTTKSITHIKSPHDFEYS